MSVICPTRSIAGIIRTRTMKAMLLYLSATNPQMTLTAAGTVGARDIDASVRRQTFSYCPARAERV
jgi:hypothetical protein